MPHRVRIPSNINTPLGAGAEALGAGINTAREHKRRDRQLELTEQQRELQQRRLRLEELGLGLDLQEQRRQARTDQMFNETLGTILGGGQAQTQAGAQSQAGGHAGAQQSPATASDSGSQRQSRLKGLQIVDRINKLGRMPKSVRGPQIDTFAAAFEQRTGRKIAPNVLETLKKGNTDDLALIGRSLASRATQDQQFNSEQAVQMLSDPQASAELLTEVGSQAESMRAADETQERAGGATAFAAPQQAQPQAQPIDQQAAPQRPQTPGISSQVQAIDRKRQQIQQVQARLPLNSDQRARAEAVNEVLTDQRNDLLLTAEAGIRERLSDASPEDKLESLRQLQNELIRNGAPDSQIQRVREDIDALQSGEDRDVVGVSVDFRETAMEMFPSDQVTNESGEFDVSRLTPEQVRRVNERAQAKKRAVAAAGSSQEFKSELLQESAKRGSELAATSRMIGTLQEGPQGAVGSRAAIGSAISNIIGQFPGGQGVANRFTRFMTGGLDQSQLQQLRTQGRQMIAEAATSFTGDSGGRLSNQDLERVDRALPINEFFTTKDRTIGAFKELAAIQKLSETKANIMAGQGLGFDPNDNQSVANQAKLYKRQFGMTNDEALGLVRDQITLSEFTPVVVQ